MQSSSNPDLLLPNEYLDLLDKGNLALYGYGFLGQWIWKFFAERYKAQLPVFDITPKKSPVGNALPLRDLQNFKGVVLLSCRHHIKQVSSQFEALGVKCISTDALFIKMLASERDQVIGALSHDDLSVKTYLALEKILCSGTMCETAHLVGNQYFQPPEFFPTFNDSFVDAGAFCGDTLERFIIENLGTFNQYFGFEPGSRQFDALSYRAERLKREWALGHEKLSLNKLGLGSNFQRLAFDESSTDSMSHTFSDVDDEMAGIELTTLDNFLGGRLATSLKSDIEGMDYEFLVGAKETIIRNRPKMAISCYHYPTDLVNMIKYISDFSLDYKFKLRHHANVIGDYVLYAY
jgi:FkbM family methyltransferase